MEKSKGEKPPKVKKEIENKAKDTPQDEFGGPKGLEPSRYGDWERKGIVSDF